MVEVYSATQGGTQLPYTGTSAGNGLKRQNMASPPPLGLPHPIQTPMGINKANPNDPDAKAKQAAQQFEAVFINQILQQLDKTIDRSDSMLNGGHAEETFRGMMMQEMATNISSKPGGSGFGLSEVIYRQIKQQQGETLSPNQASPNQTPLNHIPHGQITPNPTTQTPTKFNPTQPVLTPLPYYPGTGASSLPVSGLNATKPALGFIKPTLGGTYATH